MPQARFKPRSSIHTYDSLANLKLGVLERVLQRAFGDGNMDAWFDSLIQVNESNSTALINAVNMVGGAGSVNIGAWPDAPLSITEVQVPVQIPANTLWYHQDANLTGTLDSAPFPKRTDAWWFCPIPPGPELLTLLVDRRPSDQIMFDTYNSVSRTFTHHLDFSVGSNDLWEPNPATLAGNSFFTHPNLRPLTNQHVYSSRGFEEWVCNTDWRFLRSPWFRMPGQGEVHWQLYLESTDDVSASLRYRNLYVLRSWSSLTDGERALNTTYAGEFYSPGNGFVVKHHSEYTDSAFAAQTGTTHRLFLNPFSRGFNFIQPAGSNFQRPEFSVDSFDTPYGEVF